jgi:hypothetical protein
MPDLAQPQPTIVLRACVDRFSVAIRPCPDDRPSPSDFPDYIAARTFARSVRWESGWPITDEVPAAVRKAAEEAEERRIEAKRRHG